MSLTVFLRLVLRLPKRAVRRHFYRHESVAFRATLAQSTAKTRFLMRARL